MSSLHGLRMSLGFSYVALLWFLQSPEFHVSGLFCWPDTLMTRLMSPLVLTTRHRRDIQLWHPGEERPRLKQALMWGPDETEYNVVVVYTIGPEGL